ncbi:hypothetical protein HDU96_002787 [Phlyctochytrium bullatum]|nr:hypothetical protein HDU96_002787 [Phlyctochytrium bullatum]
MGGLPTESRSPTNDQVGTRPDETPLASKAPATDRERDAQLDLGVCVNVLGGNRYHRTGSVCNFCKRQLDDWVRDGGCGRVFKGEEWEGVLWGVLYKVAWVRHLMWHSESLIPSQNSTAHPPPAPPAPPTPSTLSASQFMATAASSYRSPRRSSSVRERTELYTGTYRTTWSELMTTQLLEHHLQTLQGPTAPSMDDFLAVFNRSHSLDIVEKQALDKLRRLRGKFLEGHSAGVTSNLWELMRRVFQTEKAMRAQGGAVPAASRRSVSRDARPQAQSEVGVGSSGSSKRNASASRGRARDPEPQAQSGAAVGSSSSSSSKRNASASRGRSVMSRPEPQAQSGVAARSSKRSVLVMRGGNSMLSEYPEPSKRQRASSRSRPEPAVPFHSVSADPSPAPAVDERFAAIERGLRAVQDSLLMIDRRILEVRQKEEEHMEVLREEIRALPSFEELKSFFERIERRL